MSKKKLILTRLNKFIDYLDNKEEYRNVDFDDLDSYEITDIESLFNIITDDEYYEARLIESAFNNKYEKYEIRGDRAKQLSYKEYLWAIATSLGKLINKKKSRYEQKIRLVTVSKFMHLIKSNELTIHTWTINVMLRLTSNTENLITELYDSLLEEFEKEQQTLRGNSSYVSNYVEMLHVYFHTINLKRGSSYIKTPRWIENKKATVNPENLDDDRYFQYAALHHENIIHPERISVLKRFVNNYYWKDINFPSDTKDWEAFERKNEGIALNILSVLPNKKEINIIYTSRHNCSRHKQVILLMISDNNEENEPNKWHYIAVTSISALYRGVTSNNNGDLYCLNCLHSYRTENARNDHQRLCYYNNILKFDNHKKSMKVPHVFYADTKALLVKIQSVQNNPEESYTEKKTIHEPSGYALSLVTSYDQNKDTHEYYRGKDFMKKFCRDLKNKALELVNIPEETRVSLTNTEIFYHEYSSRCHICEKGFCYDQKDPKVYELYRKVKHHCFYTGYYKGASHHIC